jgi:hypothetical protein
MCVSHIHQLQLMLIYWPCLISPPVRISNYRTHQQRSPAFGHTAKAGGSYVQPPVRVAQVSFVLFSSPTSVSWVFFGTFHLARHATVRASAASDGRQGHFMRPSVFWDSHLWRSHSPSSPTVVEPPLSLQPLASLNQTRLVHTQPNTQVSWDAETDTITPDSKLPGWVFTDKLVVKPYVLFSLASFPASNLYWFFYCGDSFSLL